MLAEKLEEQRLGFLQSRSLFTHADGMLGCV